VLRLSMGGSALCFNDRKGTAGAWLLWCAALGDKDMVSPAGYRQDDRTARHAAAAQ